MYKLKIKIFMVFCTIFVLFNILFVIFMMAIVTQQYKIILTVVIIISLFSLFDVMGNYIFS